MKIRKKTLDAIHSILTSWHGEDGAANSLVAFHPQPVAIDSLVDQIVARAVPPWVRKFNEIKLAWVELVGSEIARRCRVSHLNEGVLYLEVFHPAYRMALDAPRIRGMILEKVVKVLGAENCRELKFIPVGRSGPVVPSVSRRSVSAFRNPGKHEERYTPDLPL